MDTITISDRVISKDTPPYVIAEIGANHNGDMVLCKRLIDAARSAGADAVKFQSWTPHSLISTAEYERHQSYGDKNRHFGTLREMVEKYYLSDDAHAEIAQYCNDTGITFLSTPFSASEVDLLETLDVSAFKVASMDVNHIRLLKHIGSKGRPVILSTGMSSLGEIEVAVDTLRNAGSGPVGLLHCVSIYPPEYSTINLKNIELLSRTFGCIVGFSDHTIGTAIPLAAIACGARIIEKHFTLDKDALGWDHWVSATPNELEEIVQEGRNIVKALGDGRRRVSPAEVAQQARFRRRACLSHRVSAGQVLTDDDLEFKRPGNGISPPEAPYVIGRRVRRDLPEDHELEWTDLD